MVVNIDRLEVKAAYDPGFSVRLHLHYTENHEQKVFTGIIKLYAVADLVKDLVKASTERLQSIRRQTKFHADKLKKIKVAR